MALTQLFKLARANRRAPVTPQENLAERLSTAAVPSFARARQSLEIPAQRWLTPPLI
ncbi:hypothetical protein LPB260_27150 [Pseudomonas sp. LPB0260]|uniref:hypothetical protein n=1 Tax=Pseudomonas sp. LPB0260 TaxID=2614442 RepID=UPI0015C23E16|nr:hypothetical protein [Pseudomonas sp. LPB0260]QLC74362.1 hypothetical protein LPB260_12200 [Pseudomonas sp. LPB0260]QLC77132.1 hypothetical protein LPB260_27150 [Pseudomonas sp. LPB0260]